MKNSADVLIIGRIAAGYTWGIIIKSDGPRQRGASRRDARRIPSRPPSGGLLSACTESRQRCIQGGLWASTLKIPCPVHPRQRGAGTASTVRRSFVAGALPSRRQCAAWVRGMTSGAAQCGIVSPSPEGAFSNLPHNKIRHRLHVVEGKQRRIAGVKLSVGHDGGTLAGPQLHGLPAVRPPE